MLEAAPDDTSYITYAEAARILKVSTRTVHRLREDGRIEAIVQRTPRNGSKVRFRRSDVEQLLRAGAA